MYNSNPKANQDTVKTVLVEMYLWDRNDTKELTVFLPTPQKKNKHTKKNPHQTKQLKKGEKELFWLI